MMGREVRGSWERSGQKDRQKQAPGDRQGQEERTEGHRERDTDRGRQQGERGRPRGGQKYRSREGGSETTVGRRHTEWGAQTNPNYNSRPTSSSCEALGCPIHQSIRSRRALCPPTW